MDHYEIEKISFIDCVLTAAPIYISKQVSENQ
jgi:hypothetical protein